MSTNAKEILFFTKKIKLHNTFVRRFIVNKVYTNFLVYGFLLTAIMDRPKEIAMRIYNIAHTIPKTKFGGANVGFIDSYHAPAVLNLAPVIAIPRIITTLPVNASRFEIIRNRRLDD